MSTKGSRAGWLPTDPRQIGLAVALVVVVGGCIAWVWYYQSQQPQPVPKSKYEAMYKAMYGSKQPPASPRPAQGQ